MKRYVWSDNDEFWNGIEHTMQNCIRSAKERGWRYITICQVKKEYFPTVKNGRKLLEHILHRDCIFSSYTQTEDILDREYKELEEEINTAIRRWMKRNRIHFSFTVDYDKSVDYDLKNQENINADKFL